MTTLSWAASAELIDGDIYCGDREVEVPQDEAPVGEGGQVLLGSAVNDRVACSVDQPHGEVECEGVAIRCVEPLHPPPVRHPLHGAECMLYRHA